MGNHLTRQILGKLGFGLACAVCCVLPMLVLAGLVTGASLAIGGAVFVAVASIVITTVLVATGRAGAIATKARVPLAGLGCAAAAVGLWGISTGRTGAPPIVILSVAALTVAALLSLTDAGPRRTQS